MHESTNRARRGVVVAEQRDAIHDAARAEPLDFQSGVDGVWKTGARQETAARFGDDADRRQVADVGARGLHQEPVHRGIEERVIGHVVDVPVVVVVHPARRHRTQRLEAVARGERLVGHQLLRLNAARAVVGSMIVNASAAPMPKEMNSAPQPGWSAAMASPVVSMITENKISAARTHCATLARCSASSPGYVRDVNHRCNRILPATITTARAARKISVPYGASHSRTCQAGHTIPQ